MFKKRRLGPDLSADLFAAKSLSLEGLQGRYIIGLGKNANPLSHSSLGCLPNVWTQEVRSV